jgi:hypothetical protein
MLKESYCPPVLVEYGRIDEVTLGAWGSRLDVTISFNPLAITTDPGSGQVQVCLDYGPSGACIRLK